MGESTREPTHGFGELGSAELQSAPIAVVDDADHLDHVAPVDHDYQLPGGNDA